MVLMWKSYAQELYAARIGADEIRVLSVWPDGDNFLIRIDTAGQTRAYDTEFKRGISLGCFRTAEAAENALKEIARRAAFGDRVLINLGEEGVESEEYPQPEGPRWEYCAQTKDRLDYYDAVYGGGDDK